MVRQNVRRLLITGNQANPSCRRSRAANSAGGSLRSRDIPNMSPGRGNPPGTRHGATSSPPTAPGNKARAGTAPTPSTAASPVPGAMATGTCSRMSTSTLAGGPSFSFAMAQTLKAPAAVIAHANGNYLESAPIFQCFYQGYYIIWTFFVVPQISSGTIITAYGRKGKTVNKSCP